MLRLEKKARQLLQITEARHPENPEVMKIAVRFLKAERSRAFKEAAALVAHTEVGYNRITPRICLHLADRILELIRF